MKPWTARCAEGEWQSAADDGIRGVGKIDMNGCCPSNWLFNHRRIFTLDNTGAVRLDAVVDLPEHPISS